MRAYKFAEIDGSPAQLATRIGKNKHRLIQIYCIETGISITEYINTLIDADLRGKKLWPPISSAKPAGAKPRTKRGATPAAPQPAKPA